MDSYDKTKIGKKVADGGDRKVYMYGTDIDVLASGGKLPASYKDHSLNGELSKYRECHIQGDLLLIYRIEKENLILVLVDIGSHSQLF